MQVNTDLDIGERVIIDGDASLIATICAILINASNAIEYKIGYVHNGDLKEAWVTGWRLQRVGQ